MSKITELARSVRRLKSRKSQLKDELADCNQAIEKQEEELAQLMMDDEMQSFKADGTLFYLITKPLASVKVENQKEFYNLLREQGHGDLVKETVNYNTLNAFVRSQISENKGNLPDWMAELVNVYTKTSVGMRKN